LPSLLFLDSQIGISTFIEFFELSLVSVSGIFSDSGNSKTNKENGVGVAGGTGSGRRGCVTTCGHSAEETERWTGDLEEEERRGWRTCKPNQTKSMANTHTHCSRLW